MEDLAEDVAVVEIVEPAVTEAEEDVAEDAEETRTMTSGFP